MTRKQQPYTFFYTVWCPHCKTAQPVWKSLKEKIGDKKNKWCKVKFCRR